MRIMSSRSFGRAASVPAVFASSLLVWFHYALLLYVASSYIELELGTSAIAILYGAGAVLNLILLANSSRILSRLQNWHFFLVLLALEFGAVAGLSLNPSPTILPLLFIVQFAAVYQMSYSLDVFLEQLSTDARTGRIRTAYLTVSNLAVAASPLVSGALASGGSYGRVFGYSLLALVPVAVIAATFLRRIKLPAYRPHNALSVFGLYFAKPNLRRIFTARLVLDSFYAMMVIYTPLFLHGTLGFSWTTIGAIFTVMLLPFVLFEVPIGRIADARLGEKEIMAAGFAVMTTFTALIPFLGMRSAAVWAAVLFMTRVGASAVEATVETYFFKNISAKNEDFIGVFRTSQPLSYLIGPAAASVLLAFFPLSGIFIMVAAACLLGFAVSLALKDTR